MFNADPPFPHAPTLSTEAIQKYLEENKELIMAILECQNQGMFAEAAQCLARLQFNLTNLAKLADAVPQAQTNSQGQDMQQQQHPTPLHVAMSQQQQDLPTLSSPFNMKEQLYQQQHQQQQPRQQQHHLAMSLQQSDISTSRLPFQMNEQQHKLPGFSQQLPPVPGPMVGNYVAYQAAQARLSNMSDMPETSLFGSDFGSGWSLGMSPSGPTTGNKRS